MSEESKPIWRTALDVLAERITAARFQEEYRLLRERYGSDPEYISGIYTATLISLLIESAGLFAALQSPVEQVPAALAEIRETLASLDFNTHRKRLKRAERRCYDFFAEHAAPLMQEVGEAMEALFNCYISGDYDSEANPDELLVEALEIAPQDIERAYRLIAQAGAIALHSRPLWWRWQFEAQGPAGPRLAMTAILVESYTGGGEHPLGPLAQARAEFQESVPEITAEEWESEEAEPSEAEMSPVDNLIEELIAQGQARWTQEQLALCQAHREEAIPALINLATDEDMQMEDAPGEGYAPIRAVELLGELQAVEAIRPLIDIIADTEPDAIIRDTAAYALVKIGSPVLEDVLAFMRYSRDTESKVMLADVVHKVGQEDERAFQILLDVWNEATWEEGRCLLAHALARTGGERAIPVLQAALRDPDLEDMLDYNEVASALEELGVELPSDHPAALYEISDLAEAARYLVHILGEPEHLESEAETMPEELRAEPDDLAHFYVFAHLCNLSAVVASYVICTPADYSRELVSRLLEATETLTFDASTRGRPQWVRKAYRALTEHAGPEFRQWFSGMLFALQHYLANDYDIAEEPDRLLAVARDLDAGDKELARLFGRAGALVLHGRPMWQRWLRETDPPLSYWLFGLEEFYRPLQRSGHIPLRPGSEEYTPALVSMLMEARFDTDQPLPQVSKLLDLLVTRGGDLSPAERRRFAAEHTAVVPHLIRILEDKNYWYKDGPGGGWAAILAARLLGELRASQAAGALVDAVADSEPGDLIHDAALLSLMAIGRPAFPAVEAYFRYGRDIVTKASLAEVMGRIGPRGAETFDFLRQVWEDAGWAQNRRMVALAFGDLGDRRAVPLLRSALQDRAADAMDMDYVAWALQKLGAPVAELPQRPARLKTPAPYTPRLLHDSEGRARRIRHNSWGEPLCPDCGEPLVLAEDGWSHPEPVSGRAAPVRQKRRRKRKRR